MLVLAGMGVLVVVLAISGSGRGAGKTAVGCALMAALPELSWTAVKVTPHGHGLPLGLVEETDRNSDKDTGRYLAAGARRAFLLTVDEHWGGGLVPGFNALMPDGVDVGAVLVESNRFALSDWSRSGVKLAVIGAGEGEWKVSLRACALAADALVLTAGMQPDDLPTELCGRNLFVLPAGKWTSPAIVEFVRGRLTRLAAS
jgi:hypothetical protein